MHYGDELLRYVDEGAVQWNIGIVPKLCAVIVGRHVALALRENPLGGFMDSAPQGVQLAIDRLHQLGISPPKELSGHFLLKTGEVFVWFAEKHQLTWDQLVDAIQHVQSACENDAKDVVKQQR